jgi:hypothetical protein
METRRVKISLETLLKRSWPLFAVGAVLLVILSWALYSYAISGKARGTSQETATSTSSTTETVSSTEMMARALDGVMVPGVEARLQPFAVMVENHVDARPLSGPARANLAFEFPVEGGITRFMLVFDATTTVDQIGPVRSARPYFVDMADALGAVYAHVGGSPDALALIEGKKTFRDLNEFWNGRYYWRSAKRVAPHNTFTRTDLLKEAAETKGWKAPTFTSWSYKDEDAIDGDGKRGTENGPTLAWGGSYSVKWEYDRNENRYLRKLLGSQQTDADGEWVTAKNILVLQTDQTVLDNEGRLQIRTLGKGKGFLYRDGKKNEVVWHRTPGATFQIDSIDGANAFFNPGTTWVEVVTSPSVFVFPSSTPPPSATSTHS